MNTGSFRDSRHTRRALAERTRTIPGRVACAWLLLFLLGLLPLSGYGGGKQDEKLPPLTPVKGKVTVDGQPLTGGQVALHTLAKDKAGAFPLPQGKIDASGNYEIFTGGQSGAPLETYKVVVSPQTVPTEGGKGGMPINFNPQFTDSWKTPLRVQVTASPQAGAYDLKLTK